MGLRQICGAGVCLLLESWSKRMDTQGSHLEQSLAFALEKCINKAVCKRPEPRDQTKGQADTGHCPANLTQTLCFFVLDRDLPNLFYCCNGLHILYSRHGRLF